MPPLSIAMGTLGLDYITRCGGTRHFPEALAQPLLDAGIARVVPEERPYNLPIYAIHPADADASVLKPAFTGLRAIVGG